MICGLGPVAVVSNRFFLQRQFGLFHRIFESYRPEVCAVGFLNLHIKCHNLELEFNRFMAFLLFDGPGLLLGNLSNTVAPLFFKTAWLYRGGTFPRVQDYPNQLIDQILEDVAIKALLNLQFQLRNAR